MTFQKQTISIYFNKINWEKSFHQREGCLRGYCILINRSNGPPAFECTFICKFVLKWILFIIRHFSVMSFHNIQFLCTYDSFYHILLSCFIFFQKPKCFQCLMMFCNWSGLYHINWPIGSKSNCHIKRDVFVRSCFIQNLACAFVFIRKSITRIKTYYYHQASVMFRFLHWTWFV